MKLIKITEEHYIIVDENIDINENDYTFKDGEILEVSYLLQDNGHIITHSTQPLNCNCSNRDYKLDTNCAERNHCFDKIQYLSLQEVKELIGEVDVEKKAEEEYPLFNQPQNITTSFHQLLQEGYIKGYNQALEDNKDKKYTEEDMRIAIRLATTSKYDHKLEFYSEQDILQYLHPKTEWEVEIVDGKLKIINGL